MNGVSLIKVENEFGAWFSVIKTIEICEGEFGYMSNCSPWVRFFDSDIENFP
jgi:hypothetical protein